MDTVYTKVKQLITPKYQCLEEVQLACLKWMNWSVKKFCCRPLFRDWGLFSSQVCGEKYLLWLFALIHSWVHSRLIREAFQRVRALIRILKITSSQNDNEFQQQQQHTVCFHSCVLFRMSLLLSLLFLSTKSVPFTIRQSENILYNIQGVQHNY